MNKPTTIFRKDFDNRPAYSRAVQYKKGEETKYAYLPVQFRKGVELGNKAKITIKDSWISAYEGKNGIVFYEFIADFETEIPSGFAEVTDADIPF